MPNTHITKNYFSHGGDELVIGGRLTFLPGAEVEGGEGLFDGAGSGPILPVASAETLGGVKVGSGLAISDGVLSADGIAPAAYQADSEATTIAALKEDFNALLTALQTAGLMTAAPAEEPDDGD